jgi:hypothetical protein
MSMKIAPDFARCARPKLCLGETSDRKFVFWVCVSAGGVSGAVGGVWFGDGIHQVSEVRLGWIIDVHTQSHSQFNGILIDINTTIPFNVPSSRQIPCSQDINPMLNFKVEMPVPQPGRRNPGPPERGRGPLGRHRPSPRRGNGRAKNNAGACRARVWFSKHNSDSRQDFYAVRNTS